MNTVQIDDGQILLLVLRGLLSAAMPFAVFFWLRQKHGGRGFPMFIGMVAVMLLLLPRKFLQSIFLQGAETVTGKWLTVWVIGASCEEIARYIAMKHALPNYDMFTDALCYGIGHGGTEVVMSAKAQFVLLVDAMGHHGTPEHLAAISEQGILTAAEVLIGNADNLVFHMALSVLIAHVVYQGGSKKMIPLAIFLHVLADYTIFCFDEAASLLLTVVICAVVYFVIRKRNAFDMEM